MKYKIIDKETYYRKDVLNHFSIDCKCSTSITSKIDVTKLIEFSKKTNTKFYINFLYLLGKVMNSRDDYKMCFLYKTNQLICFDKINLTHYIFHQDTETCTPIHSEFNDDYKTFYSNAAKDIEEGKKVRRYDADLNKYINYFDASYISRISYESLNIELPDGYLYFQPIVNWGRYKEENGKFMMPLTIRMNHAIADGYLIAKVYLLLEEEINKFVTI